MCPITMTPLQVGAPAKAGTVAPLDVTVPAQATTLGPEKTSFFQALAIQTKISKGTIEILNDVKLIKLGDKVGASEATLLQMLGITPFSYGLVIEKGLLFGFVYDLAFSLYLFTQCMTMAPCLT